MMRRRHAFTLVELLVAVAVIALLIGILLPALSSARESANAVACVARIRNVTTAALNYAAENDGRLWHVNDWLRSAPGTPAGEGLANHTGREPGLIFDYMDGTSDVLACPKNKRRIMPVAGWTPGEAQLPKLKEHFPGDYDLDTDFTMMGSISFARTHRRYDVLYRTEGGIGGVTSFQNTPWPIHANHAPGVLTRMRTLPVFVEESLLAENQFSTDARWLYRDQLTERHQGGASIAYLDGSAERFDPPGGAHSPSMHFPDQQQGPHRLDPQDLEVGSIYLRGYWNNRSYYVPNWGYPISGEPPPIGWIDKPTFR